MKRVVLLAAAFLLLFVAPACAAPSPGAPGIGDRLNPAIGNGGYDVQHYDLDLRYATSAPSQSLDGTVTIVARATQDLSRFNLDFAGGAVGAVSVNGKAARFAREGEELVITPSRYLRKGGEFVVRVSHFIATPTVPGDEPSSTGFFITPDGSATAPQPWFAHFIFPSNDHPRDKASYTFRIDVPAGTTAAANGLPLGKLTHRGRTTWVFLQRQPMATELVADRRRPLRRDRQRPHPRRLLARRHRAEPDRDDAADPRAAAGAHGLDGGPRRALPVRRLRRPGRRRRARLRARDPDAVALRQALVHRRTRRTRGTRRWSTSSRTRGSATASRPTSGATCGSTRATRAGTSSSTPRRTASSRATPRTTRTRRATPRSWS